MELQAKQLQVGGETLTHFSSQMVFNRSGIQKLNDNPFSSARDLFPRHFLAVWQGHIANVGGVPVVCQRDSTNDNK